MEENYEGCYGPVLSLKGITEKLLQAFVSDTEAEEKRPGERFSTVIWGRAGIGKTSLVRCLETERIKYRGKDYSGFKIIYIPLADIEEVGDIIGMPDRHLCVRKGKEEKWVPESCIGLYTEKLGYSVCQDRGVKQFTAVPEWVPEPDEKGYCQPTIILVDDFNRANLRVLKACMPLFQTYSTIGWKLPKGCHIVLTANPGQQDYQVTELDPAILTRMRHVTFGFDIKEWINWADEEGLDKNVLGFCAYYPEMMFGKLLTNPRTITEAFRMIQSSGIDLNVMMESRENIKNIKNIMNMLLDNEFTDSFATYMLSGERVFLSPEDILTAPEFSKEKIKKLISKDVLRLDIISIISYRLLSAIISEKIKFTQERADNFYSFLFDYGIPIDIVMSILLEMNKSNNLLTCFSWLKDERITSMFAEYYQSKI